VSIPMLLATMSMVSAEADPADTGISGGFPVFQADSLRKTHHP
jgi:hypothetical protein